MIKTSLSINVRGFKFWSWNLISIYWYSFVAISLYSTLPALLVIKLPNPPVNAKPSKVEDGFERPKLLTKLVVKTKELTTLICGVIVDTIDILVEVVGAIGNVDDGNPIREPNDVLKVSWGVLFAVVGASNEISKIGGYIFSEIKTSTQIALS